MQIFIDRKVSKFKEWLKIGSYNEVKPTQEVMEVLCYLAYDTVREVNQKQCELPLIAQLPMW